LTTGQYPIYFVDIKSIDMRRLLPLLVLLQASYTSLFAQAGSLDNSFAGNGKKQTLVGVSSGAAAIAYQPWDQEIVVAGGYSYAPGNSGILVVRYTKDGTLDNSFGSGGEVQITFSSAQVVANCMAIQSDRKIVIAGAYLASGGNWVLYVTRLTSTGAVDGSFNNIGFNTVAGYHNVGDQVGASGIALQSDGKIVVTGEYYEEGSGDGKRGQFDFGVLRFTTDGLLDNSFGTGGQAIINPGSKKNFPTAVAVTSGGNIVVCGYRQPWFFDTGGTDSAIVMQLTTNGILDATHFGSGGIVRYNATNNDGYMAKAMTLQSNGMILIAGTYWYNGDRPNFTVTRLNADGSFDNNFSGNGRVGIGFGNPDYASGIGVEPGTGAIVVSGIHDDQFAVCRLLTDGTLDGGFGTGGKVTIPWTSSATMTSVSGLAIQANGRILVTGTASTSELDGRMATIRLLSSGSGLAVTNDSVTVTSLAAGFAIDNNPRVRLYPNPAATQLQVTGLPMDAPATLAVTDMVGNTLLQHHTGQGSALLDITRLAPAPYILTITTATGQRQSLSFVKTGR